MGHELVSLPSINAAGIIPALYRWGYDPVPIFLGNSVCCVSLLLSLFESYLNGIHQLSTNIEPVELIEFANTGGTGYVDLC